MANWPFDPVRKLLLPMLVQCSGDICGLLKFKPMTGVELQNARCAQVCSQTVGKIYWAGVVSIAPENEPPAGNIVQVRLPLCTDVDGGPVELEDALFHRVVHVLDGFDGIARGPAEAFELVAELL